jgi:hypothetical protein
MLPLSKSHTALPTPSVIIMFLNTSVVSEASKSLSTLTYVHIHWIQCSTELSGVTHCIMLFPSPNLIRKTNKSRTRSDVQYSCHRNLSGFTFHIFAHLWCFPVFHSLQSITHRIYEPKTTVHLLNLKWHDEWNQLLKHKGSGLLIKEANFWKQPF